MLMYEEIEDRPARWSRGGWAVLGWVDSSPLLLFLKLLLQNLSGWDTVNLA